MDIIKLHCKKINGENGAYTEIGNKTVTFSAEIPSEDNKRLVKKSFIIYGVGETDDILDAAFYARQYAMYYMCGYLFNDRDYVIT